LGKLLVLPANVRLDWKVIARYKHSSLFGLVFCNEEKSFITLTPGGTTTGLWTHLRAHHKLQFEQAVAVRTEQKRLRQDGILVTIKDENSLNSSGRFNDSIRSDRSPVWKIFEKGNDLSTCNLCDAVINTSRGTTSGLWTHLKTHHKAAFIKAFEERKEQRRLRIDDFQRSVKEEKSSDNEAFDASNVADAARRSNSPVVASDRHSNLALK
jgi:BED zinc finger